MDPQPTDTLIIADTAAAEEGWDPAGWAADPPALVISLGDLCTAELAEVLG